MDFVSASVCAKRKHLNPSILTTLPYVYSKNGYVLYEKSDVQGMKTNTNKTYNLNIDDSSKIPKIDDLIESCCTQKKIYGGVDYGSAFCNLPDIALEKIGEEIASNDDFLKNSIRDLSNIGRTSKALRLIYIHGMDILSSMATKRFDSIPLPPEYFFKFGAPPIKSLKFMRDNILLTKQLFKEPSKVTLKDLQKIIHTLPVLPPVYSPIYGSYTWSLMRKDEKIIEIKSWLSLYRYKTELYADNENKLKTFLNFLYEKRLIEIILSRNLSLEQESDIEYAKVMFDIAVVKTKDFHHDFKL